MSGINKFRSSARTGRKFLVYFLHKKKGALLCKIVSDGDRMTWNWDHMDSDKWQCVE